MREHRVAAGREPIVFLLTLHREDGPRGVPSDADIALWFG